MSKFRHTFTTVYYRGDMAMRVSELESGEPFVLTRDFARVISLTVTDDILPSPAFRKVFTEVPTLEVDGERYRKPAQNISLANACGVNYLAGLKGTRDADRVSKWLRHTIFSMIEDGEISEGVLTQISNERDLHYKVVDFIRDRFPSYSDNIIAGLGGKSG